MGVIREEGDEDNGRSQEHDTEETVEVEGEPEARQEPEVEVLEDERPNAEADDDEGESRPSRRRETAAERRERARQAKLRDKRELNFQKAEIDRLARELENVKRTQIVTSVTELDNRIATANEEAAQMDRVKAAAISKNNGADAVAADNLRNQALWRAQEAQAARERLVAEANRPVAKPVPYIEKAKAFMADNPWYNHNGTDEDSQLVKQIDNEVAKEYVPLSDAYWKELQRRVDKNLPHRAKQTQDDGDDDYYEQETRTTTRRGPPTGGTSRSSSGSSNGSAQQIRLSPERVQGLKDAGLWDDPKDRMRMAKKYAEYDRQNKQSRG
jgi:uncharacterized small protein (DUF1192 family)